MKVCSRRQFVATCAAAAVCGSRRFASAHPVWPGRFEEIAFGVDRSHPYRSGSANERRDNRVGFAGPSGSPEEVWQTPLRAGRPSAPAVSREGVLYVANAGGLHALSNEGTLIWSQAVGFVASTPSMATEESVVVGTQAGELIGVREGVVRLRVPVGSAVRGSPLVLPDGSFAVSTFDRAIHRIDISGRVLFRTTVAWPSSGSLAWDGDVVVVATADRVLFVSTDGGVLRSVAVGAPAMGGPTLGPDGTVWVLGQDMTVRRVPPGDRAVQAVELGVPVGPMVRLAVDGDGSVRVPTRGDALLCLGPSGTERWRVTGEGSFLGGAVIDSESRTYVVNDRGVVLGIDPSGRVLWRTQLRSRSDVAPVIGEDRTLYVVDVRGTVYAFR